MNLGDLASAGLAFGTVIAALVAFTPLGTGAAVGVAAALGLAADGRSVPAALGVVALASLATARPWPSLLGPSGRSAIVASVVAMAGVVVCVPDTERAVVALGATAGAGAVAALARRPWEPGLAATAVVALAIGAVDSGSRASAVVGVVAIVGVLVATAAVLCVTRGRAAAGAVLAASALSTLWCARVAGLAGSGPVAVALAAPVLAGWCAAAVVAARRRGG